MKLFARIVLFFLCSIAAFLWSCSSGGHDSASGPSSTDTGTVIGGNPKDSGKTGSDSITKPDCARINCDDTTATDIRPVVLDTNVLLMLLETMVDSGISLGVERIRRHNWVSDTDSVAVSIKKDTADFSFSINQFGLFKRIFAAAKVRAGVFSRAKRTTVLAGNLLELDSFPSFGVFGSALKLAMNAEVQGPVYVPSGSFGKQNEGAIRYTGRTQSVSVWGGAHSAFASNLNIDFEYVRKWTETEMNELAASTSSAGSKDRADWHGTEKLAGGTILVGKSLFGRRLYCPGKLTLGAGLVLKDCQVIANEIQVQDDAKIDGGLVFSSSIMMIEGEPSLAGQFLAIDSIRIEITSVLAGFPIFFVQGQNGAGGLEIVRATGEGIFLYAGGVPHGWVLPPSITLGFESDLKGFTYTRGMIGAFGRFRGSVFANSPVFYKNEVVYSGFLGYGDYGLAPVGTRFPIGGVWTDRTIHLSSRVDW